MIKSNTTVSLVTGDKLTKEDINQINDALVKEFTIPLKQEDMSNSRLFFLVKEADVIVSMAALWRVQPVVFDGEEFSLFAVLHVVSVVKSNGYGKQVVLPVKEYAARHDTTCLGFCMPKNAGFYEKCGFIVEKNSTHRFVYTNANKRITNQDGQYIFYTDSSDRFMEKVLARPDKEVSIPTESLW